MVTMSLSMNAHYDKHLVLGLEEVLGPAELERLQKHCGGSADKVDSIRKTMDEFYGASGASGLAICSGRAAFKHLLAETGREIGFEDANYCFLPTRLKIRKGLELLAAWIEKTYDLKTTVKNAGKEFQLEVKDMSEKGAVPTLCDFTSGLLQGFLTWTSGGKFYVVRETECRGAGAGQCTYTVGKFPLD
jgi:predicted hydrocarbon binding protein